MPPPRQFALTLSPSPEAPARARARVTEALRGELDPEQLATARLLVSELVTNAVVHGQGTVELRAELNDDRLRVEVIDQGGGLEAEVREQDFDEVGGQGLRIVDAEASRWGVHEGTTHVWFELEKPGPRLGT
jgi:anti-sigma regulatory factor (Ser/Thr protein kinase)